MTRLEHPRYNTILKPRFFFVSISMYCSPVPQIIHEHLLSLKTGSRIYYCPWKQVHVFNFSSIQGWNNPHGSCKYYLANTTLTRQIYHKSNETATVFTWNDIFDWYHSRREASSGCHPFDEGNDEWKCQQQYARPNPKCHYRSTVTTITCWWF